MKLLDMEIREGIISILYLFFFTKLYILESSAKSVVLFLRTKSPSKINFDLEEGALFSKSLTKSLVELSPTFTIFEEEGFTGMAIRIVKFSKEVD